MDLIGHKRAEVVAVSLSNCVWPHDLKFELLTLIAFYYFLCSIIVRYNIMHVIYHHILQFDIWFWYPLLSSTSAASSLFHSPSPSSDLFLLSGIWTDSSPFTVKAFFHPLPPCLPPPLCFLPRGVLECFWRNSRSLAERSDSIIDLIDAARQILDLWQCLYLYISSSLSSCSSR